MTRVKVLRAHSYAQRHRRAGDEYEAKPRDLAVLAAAGLAAPIPENPLVPRLPRENQPETIVADACADDRFPVVESTKPRRRYRRRDMKTED